MTKAPKLISIGTLGPDLVKDLIDGTGFKKAIENVPEEYWSMNEEELRIQCRPTKTDYSLRVALWNEVRLSQLNHGEPIKVQRIFEGICSYAHWYQNVMNRPDKLAWLLCPVRDFTQSLEPLLLKAVERYYEILDLSIKDAKGNVNPALARVVLDAAKAVENRVLGQPVERIQTQSVAVKVERKMSLEEINKKIAELESKT